MTNKTTPQPVADALPPLPASQAFSLTRSVYTADDMHTYARAALASRDAEMAKLRQGEPVAWAMGNPRYCHSSNILAAHEFTPDTERLHEWEPLYASPPPKREPQPMLTGEQIKRALVDVDGIVNPDDEFWLEVGRAIERVITERMSAGGTK